VRLHFEQNVQNKFSLLGKVIGAEQSESSTEYTTVSESFIPILSFNEEEEMMMHPDKSGGFEETLNLSQISFTEPSSQINNSSGNAKADKKNTSGEETRKSGIPKSSEKPTSKLGQFKKSTTLIT
jgi:hypothetical protein